MDEITRFLIERGAQRLDPARLVDGRTDDREVQAVAGTDIPVHHIAEMERKIHLGNRQSGRATLGIERSHPRQGLLSNIERDRANIGALSVELEDREQPIAEELQHFSAALLHRLDHTLEILVEHGDELLRRRTVSDSGEALEVAVPQHRANGLDRTAHDFAAE